MRGVGKEPCRDVIEDGGVALGFVAGMTENVKNVNGGGLRGHGVSNWNGC